MANWTEEEKKKIWDKGEIIPGRDKNVWRKDQCGAIIKWDMYGDRSDKYNCGWEIDHIKPTQKVAKILLVTQDLYNGITMLIVQTAD